MRSNRRDKDFVVLVFLVKDMALRNGVRALHGENIIAIDGNRIGRVVRGAERRCLDVVVRTNEIADIGGLAGIGNAIVLRGGLDLAHVGNARALLRVVAVLDEVRDRDGGEDADDGDHDHDFDQGEALLELFHGVFPCVWRFVFQFRVGKFCNLQNDGGTVGGTFIASHVPNLARGGWNRRARPPIPPPRLCARETRAISEN